MTKDRRLAVAYIRVSTEHQGRSGLGLEAQQEAVHSFLARDGWSLLAEHVEIGSGKRNNGSELVRSWARSDLADELVVDFDHLDRTNTYAQLKGL